MTAGAQPLTVELKRPSYFEAIKKRAADRWDQLDADPELAGPWHQLFKQVQSPRHILSELLQNADDAGATEARVTLEPERFIFEHNGEDFAEAHFASICRFGYSNKRALHTIGFRGIGFKSTFSLGDRVELYTPTLAVAFNRVRFTEPLWVGGRSAPEATTRVEVTIANALLRRELEKNLEEWLRSPVSLLFFKNIRSLQIGDASVRWDTFGPGPVAGTDWMALDGKADAPFLVVRSEPEAFPADALEEIRQERMLGADDVAEFPPCRVEIVMGAAGRLYVVLPTGVETPLPFACNAPFIQDPARLKVKDPETSPTNRWLLERAGRLAADAMAGWLGSAKTSPADRAQAYGLMPDVDREATSLEGSCAALVELAFADAIEDRNIVLLDDGRIAPSQGAIIVPEAIFEIWPAEQAMALLDKNSRPALSRHVASADRAKLLSWQLVAEFTKPDLLARLRSQHLPKPSTWRHLLNLWAYIAPDVTGYYAGQVERLRIVPVQGREVLYAASEVVRLGEKKILQSDNDWDFLAGHLIVLNQNWPRYLADQRRERGSAAPMRGDPIEGAFAVLKAVGLLETSDVSTVVEQVAAAYFRGEKPQLADCVQLAQISAKLNASTGEAFRFVTQDLHLRSISYPVIIDQDGGLEDLLPQNTRTRSLLHSDYVANFKSCSREDWQRWVSSGRSGLEPFVPLVQSRSKIYSRSRLVTEAQSRGLRGELGYSYVTNDFTLEDWDFDESQWAHWSIQARTDPAVWTKVAGRIIEQREAYWSRASFARLVQVATTGSTRSVTNEPLRAAWLSKLREKPCLPDTRGMAQVPPDLLRRTPETESLLDVEPFVHGLLDRETTRPLLDLLGVRNTPTGPARLLDRLRALAKSERPPVAEVEKWYRRLDQMLDGCSTADTLTIRTAFRTEKLILAHDGTRVTSDSVFITGDEEDVPGAALVRPSVNDLSLWRRIGVADRPSADLAMQWLATLATGATLSADDARRVRGLLARYPTRIWMECGHWLNLAGEWASTNSLRYALSLQSLFRWAHLHEWVKQQTADFQRLPTEIVRNEPFYELPALSDSIEDRLLESPLFGQGERLLWLGAFGRELARFEGVSGEETAKVRSVAERIEQTVWVTAPKLDVIPYLDGVPAGTSRTADVLWLEDRLLAGTLTKAKLAKRVPEEIGKLLSPDLKAALAYAFERSPGEIREYLEENFVLAAAAPASPPSQPADAAPLPLVPPRTVVGNPTADDATAADELLDDECVLDLADCLANGDPAADGAAAPNTVEASQAVRPQRAAPKSAGPSLMDRFALSLGYRIDGDDRFFDPKSGGWIVRSAGAKFPWERRSAAGEVQRHYLAKEHCLEREPLQIEADVWALLEQRADTYAFVLINPEGAPVEMTGTRLRALRDGGDVKLHPATYRLVYDRDH